MEVGTDRPANKGLRFGFALGFLFRRKNHSLAYGFAISVELRPTSTNGRGFLNLFIQCFWGEFYRCESFYVRQKFDSIVGGVRVKREKSAIFCNPLSSGFVFELKVVRSPRVAIVLLRPLWSAPNHCQGSRLIGALYTFFMWLV